MIFSMYDTKAESFGALFESRTCDEAIRVIFTALLKRQSSQFSEFIEDYNLFKLGDFDSSTGRIEGFSPELIKTGIEFRQMFHRYIEKHWEDIKRDNEEVEGDYDDDRKQTSDLVQSA